MRITAGRVTKVIEIINTLFKDDELNQASTFTSYENVGLDIPPYRHWLISPEIVSAAITRDITAKPVVVMKIPIAMK